MSKVFGFVKKGKKKGKKVEEDSVVAPVDPTIVKCSTVRECEARLTKLELTGNNRNDSWNITIKPSGKDRTISMYVSYYYGITLRSKKETLELIDALAQAVEIMA